MINTLLKITSIKKYNINKYFVFFISVKNKLHMSFLANIPMFIKNTDQIKIIFNIVSLFIFLKSIKVFISKH